MYTLEQYLIRYGLIAAGIAFVVVLGLFRKEWKSRKAIICWVWTFLAVDIVIKNGEFTESKVALAVIIIAGLLCTINFIGDRVETIKYKDFALNMSDKNKKPKEVVTNEG